MPGIVALALAWVLLDEARGIPTWLRLRQDLREARLRMQALRQEIASSEAEAAALRGDAFAIESAIRRDLNLARPGETVVRFTDTNDTSRRIP